MTMLQIRVEEDLKTQATLLFNELGLDLSTAIRLFLKKSLQVGGIPFDIRLSENAQKAMTAIEGMRAKSEANGNSNMTLDEINEEIKMARKERKNRK